jgi:hypothetical protein
MKTLMYDVGDGRVFMGPQLLDISAEDKRVAVGRAGITMVVNLWHRPDIELAKAVDSYRHVYIPDGRLHDDVLGSFDRLARHAALHLDEGGTVLTQCFGGRNRSAMLAGMALNYWLGISGQEALDRVRAGRGKVALANRHFAALLRSLPATSIVTSSAARASDD